MYLQGFSFATARLSVCEYANKTQISKKKRSYNAAVSVCCRGRLLGSSGGRIFPVQSGKNHFANYLFEMIYYFYWVTQGVMRLLQIQSKLAGREKYHRYNSVLSVMNTHRRTSSETVVTDGGKI